MKTSLLALAQSLRELCFPAICLFCQQQLTAFTPLHLCQSCQSRIRLIQTPLCQCCGVEFASTTGDNHYCGPCLAKPPYFSKARAILRYDDESAKLVHAFKYGGKTVARSTFCALAERATTLADLAPPELIIPVPLHRKRLQSRGFNQALVLARFLFANERRHIAVNLLRRNRWTDPQTTLSGKERRQNLKGAFSVNKPEKILGRRILLIDDVYTTGTTLNECAKILRENGAAQVEALTLARVE
ncbi:MAG: ComF family protein [Desulfobulbaceae bacterium]|nr:ComF family protein [Desulfobulbaceae bacterium]